MEEWILILINMSDRIIRILSFFKMSVFALLNIVHNDCIAGGNKSRPYLFSDAMFVVAGFIPTSCIGFGNWILRFEIYL